MKPSPSLYNIPCSSFIVSLSVHFLPNDDFNGNFLEKDSISRSGVPFLCDLLSGPEIVRDLLRSWRY